MLGLCLSCLCGVLGATQSSDALAPYRGQPILSIEIDAPRDENVDFLRSLVEIQPGYLLSASDIQDAIKRFYALGRFSNVLVFASRRLGVIEVRFELQPIRRLEDLRIQGLDEVDEGDLRRAIRIP